ncbi:MAG: UDP-3-O-(3-hydroxymyristoyl)glucosamine N-acyltransferase [Thermoanaerobaculia bacterium]|nr:MAG: UDP-3-O-(3-hydroxymyristoyl)glucosamine N-acyltransferase [Thermoanaerobaculia bacterium]
MTRSLRELAARVGGEVVGDPHRPVERIRTLDEAGPDDLSFLTSARYLVAARASRAGAILVGRQTEGLAADQLVVADPSRALAELLDWLHPEPDAAPGIHPTALLGAGAEVEPGAHVGPYAVIGARARIGAGAAVHAHAVVGEECEVGAGAVLHPHVVLYRRVRVGPHTVVHAGAVLGADGFGYATQGGAHTKIPQVGDVEIGSEVEIGALSAVDRALLGTTTVGDGTKIDNLVQVGHNVRIGRGAILCGQAGVAGSARVGDGVVLAGQAGVAGHLSLGDGVRVAAKSAVYESVEAGETVAGIPAVPIGEWRRQQALTRRLQDLWRRLRALERGAGAARRDDEEGS